MKARAFTLVELLAVVAVTGVLVVLLMPSISSMRSGADSSRCLANLRQVSYGALLWINDHDGSMPDANQWQQADGDYSLRPYLGVNPDDSARQKSVWTCPTAFRLHPQPGVGLTDNLRTYSINLYACGSQDGEITSDVRNNVLNLKGVKHPTQTSLFMDGDLLSAAGSVRRYAHSGMTSPSNIWTKEKPTGLLAVHNGRLNVVFIDGHAESIPAGLLPSAATEGSTTKAQKHPFWGRFPE